MNVAGQVNNSIKRAWRNAAHPVPSSRPEKWGRADKQNYSASWISNNLPLDLRSWRTHFCGGFIARMRISVGTNVFPKLEISQIYFGVQLISVRSYRFPFWKIPVRGWSFRQFVEGINFKRKNRPLSPRYNGASVCTKRDGRFVWNFSAPPFDYAKIQGPFEPSFYV